MSGNRTRTNDPTMITWDEFIERARAAPICRIQGHHESATKNEGRLVRWNRSVHIHVDTLDLGARGPYVKVQRVRWDWRKGLWRYTDQWMTVSWRLLDWCTWKATGDPNFTWIKVCCIDECGHHECREVKEVYRPKA